VENLNLRVGVNEGFHLASMKFKLFQMSELRQQSVLL
jgi:hypothetical protein